MKHEDIVGKKINTFTVLGKSENRNHKNRILWNVECECGKKRELYRFEISKYKSCGCRKIENIQKGNFKGCGKIGKAFWQRILRSAKDREHLVEISIEQAWEVWTVQKGICALSGIQLVFPSKTFLSDGTASLDRIDSMKGYTIDNVQWIHKDVNLMKNTLLETTFLQWCEKITQHTKQKKEKICQN